MKIEKFRFLEQNFSKYGLTQNHLLRQIAIFLHFIQMGPNHHFTVDLNPAEKTGLE
jgi:hypothetical protein